MNKTPTSQEIKQQADDLLKLAKFFAKEGRKDKSKSLERAAELLDLASQVASKAPASDKAAEKSVLKSIARANETTQLVGITLDIV